MSVDALTRSMRGLSIKFGFVFDFNHVGLDQPVNHRQSTVVLNKHRSQELLEAAAEWPPPSVGEPGIHLEGELDAAGLPRIAVEVSTSQH